MGGIPKLMDLGGDMDTHGQASLRETGTWAEPDKGETAGTGDLGGVEGGKASAGGDSGQRCRVDFDR